MTVALIVKPLIRDDRPTALRWWHVSPQPVPNREALERQARRLLEQARERTGASVERMVKTFGELQPRGAVTRRSWYDVGGDVEPAVGAAEGAGASAPGALVARQVGPPKGGVRGERKRGRAMARR